MITHRCKGSLAAGASIRYERDYFCWDLSIREAADPYRDYLKYICTIYFCPFCGKQLDEPKEKEE